MKQIASLLMASICLLAFVTPLEASEPRWGWSELGQPALTAQLPGSMARFSGIAGPALPQVTVVSVNLDPKTTRVPGVLANLWPKFKDLLANLRKVVTGDPTLKASLESRGIEPDTVVGLEQTADGRLTVLVRNAA